MARLPKTCTLFWNDAMEANKERKSQLRIAIKRTIRKKYKHCLARGNKPEMEFKLNYFGEPYIKVSNLEWGRQLSYNELYPEYPKLVKETYIHNKHLGGDTSEASVKQYLKNTYKHYIAKGTELDIKPFGILTKVSNIKWGRMLTESEL